MVEDADADVAETTMSTMTEPGKTAKRGPKPSTTLTTVKVTAGALAGAMVISGGLAVQLARGGDPVLGPKLETARIQAAQEAAQRRAAERARRRARAERREAERAAAAAGVAAPAPAAIPAPTPAPVVTRAS